MKKSIILLIAISNLIFANDEEATDSLRLTVDVAPINLVEMDYMSLALKLEVSQDDLTFGRTLWMVEGDSWYSFMSNGLGKKLTARLFHPLPDPNLRVEIRALVDGQGTGRARAIGNWVALSEAPAIILENINTAYYRNNSLEYRLVGEPGVHAIKQDNKVILEFAD
ncbi:MAG: hypothetical protein ACQEP8_06185 [Chlamydiota bacterium]